MQQILSEILQIRQKQYVFIHDVILDYLTCGDTEISAGNLKHTITTLSSRDYTQLTGFQKQFDVSTNIKRDHCNTIPISCVKQTLNQVSPDPSKVKAKAAHKNAAKNRSMDFVPGVQIPITI